MTSADATPLNEPLDEATLSRYFAAPLRYLSEGFRCVCYASSSTVLKVFREPHSLMEAFRRAGIELGAVAWSPVPGDSLASAAALVEKAIQSASEALARIPQETGLLGGRLGDEPCAMKVACWTRSGQRVISLDEHRWVVQHRAEPLALHLFSGDATRAKRAVELMLDALERIWASGATPQTEYFLDSFGLWGGKAILLDVGEIEFLPEAVESERASITLLRGDGFRRLLQDRPQVATHLENLLRQRLASGADLP